MKSDGERGVGGIAPESSRRNEEHFGDNKVHYGDGMVWIRTYQKPGEDGDLVVTESSVGFCCLTECWTLLALFNWD